MLFRSGDGYADAGCGKDCAVEQVGDDLVLAHIDETAVESRRHDETESHGEDDAQRRDDDGRQAASFELFEICFKTCREHDQYHADFGKEGKTFYRILGEDGLVWDVFDKSEQNACNEHAHHLRKSQLFAEQGEKLGCEQDESERQQDLEIVYLR